MLLTNRAGPDALPNWRGDSTALFRTGIDPGQIKPNLTMRRNA